jgi:hypothetical protein
LSNRTLRVPYWPPIEGETKPEFDDGGFEWVVGRLHLIIGKGGSAMNELSWLVNVESDQAGAFSPEEVACRFERLALTVHDLWDAVPPDRRVVGDQLGLSPAWIIGHLALLLRSVLESFGEPGPGELPGGFSETFGPGRDGSEVQDAPEALIELFDRQVGAFTSFLDSVAERALLKSPRRDDFGLRALMPHDTLQGHAAAALDYAGMYLMELATLCQDSVESGE